MKLLFLHGLGQTADSWHPVMKSLSGYDCQALELFDQGRLPENLQIMQDKVKQAIEQSDEEVCLVGLSLGAMLALSMTELVSPKLKGIVSCAGQYQFVQNRAYKRQIFLFRLLPKGFFRKHGLDKLSMLTFYKSLSGFDVSQTLKETNLPIKLICGQNDPVNLKVAEELKNLIPNSSLDIIADSGHVINKDQPEELARQIQTFVESMI
ncbi:alpha/beta fold hydrolase [Streptococcus loxodontisalivarius]|uniref:Pimeloyl-ACP methyl ester carboxylesterase n=1 Tax=Streptococcus loxodontisalivarius TaxID=1349415 RepID=A0ABS2PUD7_9STRE|nr:alpha/beta hydrolase [Streptococcus loxodontisalivarius]MBM7643084.1 pimeloyl-ACP methyl ester carboxylesterase [Streptococcus loxodontisalivarius]